MLKFRPKGLVPADVENIVGRIVMSAGMVIGQEYANPVRVLSVSRKSLQVCELQGKLDRAINRKVYTDELDPEDNQPFSLQMRTVKLICDTAAEVNAIRQLQEVIGDEYTAFMKAIPGRFQQLADELALVEVPKCP